MHRHCTNASSCSKAHPGTHPPHQSHLPPTATTARAASFISRGQTAATRSTCATGLVWPLMLARRASWTGPRSPSNRLHLMAGKSFSHHTHSSNRPPRNSSASNGGCGLKQRHWHRRRPRLCVKHGHLNVHEHQVQPLFGAGLHRQQAVFHQGDARWPKNSSTLRATSTFRPVGRSWPREDSSSSGAWATGKVTRVRHQNAIFR